MPVTALPFADLNLRRNPFGELDPDEWAEVAVVDVEPLVQGLRQPRQAIQLLGPCGRGKTTHLHALRRALPGAHYVRAWTGQPLRAPSCEVLLLDEADAVYFPKRWRALRRARSVALATHRDLSRELRWLGFQPTTVEVGQADPQRLCRIVERRIARFRRGPGPLPSVPDGLLADLLRQHGTDQRAIRDALYAHFQALTKESSW